MTATDGGPALHAAEAESSADAGVAARQPVAPLGTLLGVAKAEASLLVRSLLVLLGLLAGGVVIWAFIYPVEPVWWSTGWQIGDGQLILGVAVLVAAQLAAGRARRDGMADLYASFPVTARTRTAGQLVGLAGAVPASLLLIGATAVTVQLLRPIGNPSSTVLAGGLLLVIASGAIGIAIGVRFAHPLAGVLGALALFLVSSQSYRVSSAVIWLLPWEFKQDTLRFLPGPLAGYPPAGLHAMELAGIAALAGTVALAVAVRRIRARGALATLGILAVAVICVAGALQLRPIPAADLNHLVAEAANPAATGCTTSNQVKYCFYPGFGALLPSVEAPVNGVLAHVPARPDSPLTVSQAGPAAPLDPTLAFGHSRDQVARWNDQLQRAAAVASPAAAISLPVGEWPAFGGRLADARFNVALATAEWAVHIPLATTGGVVCMPVDQAREAIAIWLAILATHPPTGELQAGLPTGLTGAVVHNTFVPTWTYPGLINGQVDQIEAMPPQTTEAGYLLARAMTSLPEQKVARVLRDGWRSWVNPRTTDAQLAAALGITMPRVHVPQLPPGGAHAAVGPSAGIPIYTVCTSAQGNP